MKADVTPQDTGGGFQLSGPARDGNLVISGGIGGITFQLQELAAGAAKLDQLSSALGDIERELHCIWDELCQFQNEPRATGTTALAAVWAAKDSVASVRTQLQAISGKVSDCRRDYETAEGFSRTLRSLGIPHLPADYEQHADFWRTGFLNRHAMESLVAESVTAMGPIKSLLEEVLPGYAPKPLEVMQEESLGIDLEASPAGLLERIRLIEARGNGYIEVIEVQRDHRTAYVVVIPGTQMEDADSGTNPFDLGGIADGLGSRSAGVNAAVLKALQAAGAEPGAQVVAAGYSQGGIHAMNFAADEQVRSRYKVEYVLTAGSPVSRITPPPDVTTLHLEHRTDWVPGSDGSPNADGGSQVTVTMVNNLYVKTGEDVGLGPGHRLGGYEEGARLVAASADPSLVHSTAILGSVLGAGGAAKATRFSLSRSGRPLPVMTQQGGPVRERGHGGR
ncbi:alpha/beta hydrolase family protein [Arthrobacter sp. AD-310]